MAEYTLPVLKRTLEILQERGWTIHFSSYSLANGGPLNIRSAVGVAVREVAHGYYDVLIEVLDLLTKQLNGIHHWEAGPKSKYRPRTHEEVVGKLSTIIDKVERSEVQKDIGGGCPGGYSPGNRAV